MTSELIELICQKNNSLNIRYSCSKCWIPDRKADFMNSSFEYITSLEYRLKATITEVMAFKSGEKYSKMKNEYLKELRHLERVVKELEAALATAHSDIITIRNQWFEAFEDQQKDFDRKLKNSRNLNKMISINREISGKKPGGLPGHKGHGRTKQVPTIEPVSLEPPQEVLNNPDFKKTAKTIVKQLVEIRMILDVTEYHADVYYNSKTGERIHAAFPEGVVNDVNYDGSVKAFLFLLNNDGCTSINKSSKFLSDLAGGKLNISKGMINKLSKAFAKKTDLEQRNIHA